MTNVVQVSLEEAKEYIDKLDLSYIVDSMCSPQYFLARWTLDDATHCCQLYKNFLFLNKKHFSLALVPTKEIDEFWHNHILHTKKYFHDCKNIFGNYLHHQPTSSEENPNQLIENFVVTKQLYLEEFKQPLGFKRLS